MPAERCVPLKRTLRSPGTLRSAQANASFADYVLYADHVFTPQNWEQGIVHFVVCDQKGEWVIADLQNSHHPDYQSIKPTSKEGCNELLVKRLEGYMR